MLLANLFAVAAAKATTEKASSKTKKTVVVVPEDQHANFSEKLQRLAKLKDLMDEYEAEAKSLECDIKQQGKLEFLKLYKQNKTNPGSFVLKGELGGQFLFITQDKYLSITPDAANDIKVMYGEDYVATKTEYKFNSELVAKHMDALSEAIMGIETMSDEDKQNLIVPEVKHSIASGTIDKIMLIKPEQQDGFFAQINPVTQLKKSNA